MQISGRWSGSEQGGVRPVLIIQNRCREQTQSDRHLRGDHQPYEQGKASDPCGAFRGGV